jgi:hypothetical protein
MAGFVVVIMGAFVLGDMTCRQFAQIRRNPTVGYYGQDHVIKAQDREAAREELALLREIFAPRFLAAQQDVNIQLLGQVLFFEPELGEQVARNIAAQFSSVKVPAGEAAINDFFRQVKNSNDQADLWILLNAEADQAGISSSTAEATGVLSQIIPALTNGAPLNAFMTYEINRGIPEERILNAYARLIKVFRYAQVTTSGGLVTTNQLKDLVANSLETVDPNVVRIDASYFADANSPVGTEELAKQFAAWKGELPGNYTEANPYGFGYKLPSRVQLEYVAVKLDDVRSTVAKPTEKEAQAYYQQNTSKFRYEMQDPNEPNNPQKKIQATREYSEVAARIIRNLYDERVQNKANSILSEAVKIADQKLEGEYVENLSEAAYKELAGSYEDAAKAISQKEGIKLYAGKTGMLSSEDFNYGRRGYAGSLYMEGRGGNPISLRKIAFAAAKLDGTELGPFDVTTPRMFESFGPLSDTIRDEVKAMVRIVDSAPAQEAAGIDTTYSTAGIRLDEAVSKADIHSVKDAVAKDVRTVAAMAKAEAMAEELKKLDPAADWKSELAKWNTKVRKNGPGEAFTVETMGQMRRPSAMDTYAAMQRTKGMPEAAAEMSLRLKQNILSSKLFAMVSPGTTAVKGLPAVVKFEPGASVYVIKTMSVKALATTKDYEDNKAIASYFTDVMQGQGFALVHYSPRNIKLRNSYRQWESRDLAVAIDKIAGQDGSQTAAGGSYVDPIGKRFSVSLAASFTEQRDPQTSYTVPGAAEDGKKIPQAGQTLPQSVIGFNSNKGQGPAVIKAVARQSYWGDFDRDFEMVKKGYDLGPGKADVEITKMDGARAGRIISVAKGQVQMCFFFKKDGMDHKITVDCPQQDLAANADAIGQFIGSYHSLAQK